VTLLGGLLEPRNVENPARPLTDATLIDVMGPGWKTTSSVSVSEQSAVRLIAVYRAVSLVAGVIATLDLQAFRAGTARQPFASPLLLKPHVDMTRFEFWERMFFQALLNGNSYASKNRNAADAVAELEPLPMGTVTPRRVKRTERNRWGKEFVVREGMVEKTLTPWEIFHIPGPGYDGEKGLSPIGVAREGIGLGLAQQEYASRLFGSGALMAGVLTTDQQLEEPEAAALKRRWQEKVSSLAKAHEVAVLDRGAKYQPVGINPKDAQFLEARKYTVVEVARLYGIPPHLLAEVTTSTSWGTGIEQQQLGLIIFTLGPWMVRAEQRFSDECLPRGVNAEFNTRKLLRGDAKARAEAGRTFIQAGVRTPNQVAIDEGDAPHPGGDVYMIPSTHSLVDADGNLVLAAGGKPVAPAPKPASQGGA
jgi:HK97 family phage portal protein